MNSKGVAMAASIQKKRAFTIVEILVTITIIGLLLGLLLPALSGVKRQSRKRGEANNLKQVHLAWMMYANHSNDATVPGYLDVPVQAPRVMGVSRGWGLKYEFPDQSLIPPAPNYAATDPNAAGPWTWRLMKYLDHTPDFFEFYENSALATGLPEIDQESVMYHIIAGPQNPDPQRFQRAHAMAESPIFGYNGYYVGGVWKMHDVMGVQTPRFEYFNHCHSNPPPNVQRTRVSIPTTIGQIRRSTELITFCAATRIDALGIHGNFLEERPGTHLVTPPFMGTIAQWAPPPPGAGGTAVAGGGSTVEVLSLGVMGVDGSGGTHAGIPFPRYGSGTAVLFADGHIDQQQYNALADMRHWVDNASMPDYQHDDNCPFDPEIGP
jgi:prepilin-type N-terminal cleavage/methylation domain-containing protein